MSESVEALPVDDASWTEAMTTVVRYLTEFDPAAADYLEAHRAWLEAWLDSETPPAFTRHVAAYEFADALGLLDANSGSEAPPAPPVSPCATGPSAPTAPETKDLRWPGGGEPLFPGFGVVVESLR